MTRPRKQTVDYFPHTCNHGQTMFILEQKFGNDGYAFWFKLLEILGKTEGHFLDCKKMTTWHYLCTLSRVSDGVAVEILGLLSEVDAIDKDLWIKSKIIWSDNFVNGLAFAYRNRGVSIPSKPVIYPQEPGISGTTNPKNPQSKVNESKGKKSLVSPERGNGVDEEFEIWWKAYPSRRKQGKPAAIAKYRHLRKTGTLPPIQVLMATLEAQKKSLDWTKDGGDFIPGPVPYLNQGKYIDESIQTSKEENWDAYLDYLALRDGVTQ